MIQNGNLQTAALNTLEMTLINCIEVDENGPLQFGLWPKANSDLKTFFYFSWQADDDDDDEDKDENNNNIVFNITSK